MQYTLEKMITIQDYVNELVEDARYETTYERVEDYMYSLREEAINSQKAAFITIQDYVNELRAEDMVLISKVKKHVSAKASREAKELERLLA